MKRLIIASVVIVSLGALGYWGNRILERTLDAELAPLLSKQLGLPVLLGPIQAHALLLRASSPTLVMGDPKDPAVTATAVHVTLAWADLLQGDVRLVYASADDLMVRPARWPSSDSPLPDNYKFLEPYLPRTLQLESGRYVTESGEEYPVAQLRWQRHASGRAVADWREQRAAGNVDLKLELASLPALLQLAPIDTVLTVEVDGKPDSIVTLKASVAPGGSATGENAAYTLKLDVAGAGMTASTVTTGQTAWSLPDHSETSIPLLDSTRLSSLIDNYRKPDETTDIAAVLASALPRLDLPQHDGHVAISEIHFDDEISKDNTFDFITSSQGAQITNLSSDGAAGVLTGDVHIVSGENGWTVALDGSLKPRDDNGNIATQFVSSDWLLHTGRATLNGQGETWEGLLNSLQGDMSLAGYYHSAMDTPFAITAQLDKRPGEFALENIAITVGKGQLSGSAALSGTDQRKLTVDLKGSRVDLDFLLEPEDAEPLPGMALPDYLEVLPELELAVTLDISELQSSTVQLARATATLERTAHGGKLVATGKSIDAGILNLTLEANTPPNATGSVQLKAQFTNLDIPEIFRQRGIFYSRSTGNLEFRSQGDTMKDVFAAMKGTAQISMDIRADNNWRRTAVAEETLKFSGNSSLVLDSDRIVGVEIENLNIDSIEQAVTGKLSLVAGRSPWVIAALESDRLNIDSLMALLPQSTGASASAPLLPTLQRLGAAKASLSIKSLSLYELPLADVQLAFVTGPNVLDLSQLDFRTDNGTVNSQGEITWKNDRATLALNAALSNIDLDQFLIASEDIEHITVSGSAKLNSAGRNMEELAGNLTGFIDLQAANPAQGNAPEARRKLTLTATRLADGMEADINSLQWGETELSGVVRYHNTSPPLLEVDIHSGTLSLLPWENAYLKDKKKPAQPTGSTVVSLARTSASFVGNVLLTPLRMLGDDEEAKPGARLFSSDPLPFEMLKDFNLKLSARLDSLLSTAITVKQLNVTGKLKDSQLSLQARSDDLSQGTAEIDLALDANAAPPTMDITGTFKNLHGLTSRNTFPRSGFISLQSQGQSEAELAAHANGLFYLELGQGPFDYANSVLLTTNLAATVFQTLIPGIERTTPQLQCGITVALFQNGVGVTPHGFAARTTQANLLGQIHVDLGAETMQMSLDSRGRQGVGISVGSIFSNTIQIRGPLTNPGIVPDTTSLLWRGWAAIATGGLSVLGETLIKRVLATENPCTSIRDLISKDVCPVNPIAASSRLVCPTKP